MHGGIWHPRTRVRRTLPGRWPLAVTARGLCLIGLVVVLALCLVAPALAVETNGVDSGELAKPRGPAPSVGPGVDANFSVRPGTVLGTVPSTFWGVNGDGYHNWGPREATALGATPLTTVRWPSGRLADSYDVLSNRVYAADGSSTPARTSEALFVAWCAGVGCHAVIGLPGEIDAPAFAAREVAYTEDDLHFHPAYWEIGNEPSGWSHFGVAWSQWRPDQRLNATPATYAHLVGAYLTAMRAVDPGVQVLGLPGVGSGAAQEPSWIRATVLANGPRLAGVGIHVYPAGNANTMGTEAEFLATATGPNSLEARLAVDRATVRAACPRCAHLAIVATEINSGSVGGGSTGAFGRYMKGFPEVPFLATEIVQGLNFGAGGLDFYAFMGNYPGSLLGANGIPRTDYAFFTTFATHLGTERVPFSVSSTAGGLVGTALLDPGAGTISILLVNLNPWRSQQFAALGSGFPMTGGGIARSWSDRQSASNATSWPSAPPTTWTMPPLSVLLLTSERSPAAPAEPPVMPQSPRPASTLLSVPAAPPAPDASTGLPAVARALFASLSPPGLATPIASVGGILS
jgi:hypothetical protein